MQHKFLLTAVCLFVLTVSLQAQNTCVIEGYMAENASQLRKVYLSKKSQLDGSLTAIDSTTVNKGRFAFKHTLAKDEPALMYFISGFENGETGFFMEPGTVRIDIKDLAEPNGHATAIGGTATNELYSQYRAIDANCIQAQNDSLKTLQELHGKEWMNTTEAFEQMKRIAAAALINRNAERIQFVLNHNNSPLAPLMMELDIYRTLEPSSAELMQKSLSPALKNHPYYVSFSNTVHSMDLKVGDDLPDITIPLMNGESKRLSDYRGKFVLLDFWASWCGPCMREIPSLIRVYDDSKEHQDKFVLISFSLDDKEKAWKDAVSAQKMDKAGWVHGSDLLGSKSPAAKLMGVTEIPKTILIAPEGKAISFSLRGDEMVKRINQILGGDLYYQNPPQEPSEFEQKMKMIRESK